MIQTNTSERAAAIRKAIERRGLGVCISCGVELPDATGNWPRCKPCRAKHAKQCAAGIRRRNKQLRFRRIAMGVCCECKEKAAAGRNLCPKHLARNVANVAKSKAKRMALSRMREENLHTKTITHDTQEDPSNLDYPT